MDRLPEVLVDIARAAQPPAALIAGRIIAEFSSAWDARLFASLKREQGEDVTVTPGINHLFAVRTVVRSIP